MKLLKILTLLLLALPTQGQITLEDLYEKYSFYPKGIEQMHAAGEGYFTTLDRKKGILLRRYADRQFEKVLLDSLVQNGKRIRFTNYALSEDRKKILVQANIEPIYRHSYKADCFVVDVATKQVQRLTEKGKVQEATFSPQADKVAYVRDNNLFIYDLKTSQEKQLTTDGEFRKIINGLPDWVYEEEFAFSKAFAWSPNGKQLAYMKFDESAVPTYTLFTYGNDKTYPTPYTYKYPKAGATNATVSVWVYDLPSCVNKELDVRKNSEQYIPRIRWTKAAHQLLILRLNRHQNKLEYLLANTQKGSVEVAYTETNKYFIDATNFDAITFLNADEFAFLSEQGGYNSLYTYNFKTRKLAPWLKKAWDITEFYGVDAQGTAYFQAATQKPYNREIGKVTATGNFSIISKEEGCHSARFDKDFTYWIDSYTSLKTPPVYTVKSLMAHENYVLEDNAELKKQWERLALPQKELLTLPSAEKNQKLSAWRILPKGFDRTRQYPVLITQYNGPNSQQVQNKFSVSWYDYLAQEGFIVYCVDARGTAARGEEFRKQTYKQLGKLESEDMIAVGKYLQSLPYVCANAITIWGWSYGGFMSSLCLLKGQGVFSSAIAVAPVTHWRFYDSVYTERYMRTPKENPQGYDANSPLENVSKFTENTKLLLVHGTADDNVHIQNTYALTEKLVAKDIPFEMHVYTDKNHGIYGGKTRLHLYRQFMEFLKTQKD